MEEMLLIKSSDMSVSEWSGGDTREIYIYPEGSSYRERNFILRFSTAFVQDEKSTFTNLPGVQRELILLDGHMKPYRNQELLANMDPLDKCSFSGEEDITSEGVGRDVNLMLRENKKGNLSVYRIEQGREFAVPTDAAGISIKILYLTKGKGTFVSENERISVQEGDAVRITNGKIYFCAEEESLLVEAGVYDIEGV